METTIVLRNIYRYFPNNHNDETTTLPIALKFTTTKEALQIHIKALLYAFDELFYSNQVFDMTHGEFNDYLAGICSKTQVTFNKTSSSVVDDEDITAALKNLNVATEKDTNIFMSTMILIITSNIQHLMKIRDKLDFMDYIHGVNTLIEATESLEKNQNYVVLCKLLKNPENYDNFDKLKTIFRNLFKFITNLDKIYPSYSIFFNALLLLPILFDQNKQPEIINEFREVTIDHPTWLLFHHVFIDLKKIVLQKYDTKLIKFIAQQMDIGYDSDNTNMDKLYWLILKEFNKNLNNALSKNIPILQLKNNKHTNFRQNIDQVRGLYSIDKIEIAKFRIKLLPKIIADLDSGGGGGVNIKSMKNASKYTFKFFENAIPYIFTLKLPFNESQAIFYEQFFKQLPNFADAKNKDLIDRFVPSYLSIIESLKKQQIFDQHNIENFCIKNINADTILRILKISSEL